MEKKNINKALRIAASIGLYIACFLLIKERLGLIVAAFGVIPAIVAGGLTGVYGGIFIGLVLWPLDVLLANGANVSISDFFVSETLIEASVITMLGALVGWLQNSNIQAKQELASRIQIEDQLHQQIVQIEGQKNYLDALIENSPYAIVALDEENRITRVNAAFESLFSYRADELSGQDLDILVTNGNLIHEAAAMTEIVQHGDTIHRTGKRKTKDGSLIDVEIFGVPVISAGDKLGALGFYMDISERLAAEKALQAEKERAEMLYRLIPSAIFTVDTNGKVTSINDYAAELIGYPREKIIGQKCELFAAAPCSNRCGLMSDEVSKPISGAECKIITSAGETRIVLKNADLLRNDKGEIIGGIESFIDITDRRRMERALAENEQRYREIFDGVNDAIFVESFSGQILDANQPACKMFGYDHDEFLTKTVHDLVPPENRALIPAEQDVTDLSDQYFETVNIRSNGERFPASVRASIRHIGSEQVLLVLVSDISERKALQQKIRESEAKLRTIVDSAQEAIVMISSEGMVTFWNPAASQMFGYSEAEILGKEFFALITQGRYHEPQNKGMSEFRLISQGNAIGKTMELFARHKNGIEFPVELSLSSVKSDSEWAATGIIRNISQRKEAETAILTAKNIAENAARAKSEFLANMSHEIRTPLNAVIGMSGLLFDTTLNEEQQDFVGTIRNSADSLLSLINDILDFSKIEAGKMEMERQPFYLQDCVESALELLTPKAAEKHLELGYFQIGTVPISLYGDVTRLRQVLVNLLSNSVKFTEKGEVIVSLSCNPVDENSYELHFRVRDTGIGIPADKIGKLFQSFNQVDSSTTRKYGGTGLGLTISRKIIELMGGNIWVESEYGKGSVFHFTFIADKAPNNGRTNLQEEQPELRGKRVMLVDDNPTNLKILAFQTKSWGMVPYCSENPAEALEALKNGTEFDLIITDMQMPIMDGISFAKEIRKDLSPANLPVVLLTSLGQLKADDPDYRAAGFANHMTKPVKQSDLYNTLLNVIDRLQKTPQIVVSDKPVPIFDIQMGERLPLHILLAEDNLVNQKVATSILKRLGYRVDIAANGIEVLQSLERQVYDVILMDVQMPEMDGIQATNKIREEIPLARQPRIIAMTANAMDGDRERYIADGMDDYVSKPVNVEELIAALQKAKPIRIAVEEYAEAYGGR